LHKKEARLMTTPRVFERALWQVANREVRDW
jgi:hypothetical protein